jgi:hypothetical protein
MPYYYLLLQVFDIMRLMIFINLPDRRLQRGGLCKDFTQLQVGEGEMAQERGKIL